MNWLTRENVLLAAAVLVAVLGAILPQYRESITEFVDALVKFLFVVLFPEMVYRSVNVYYAAKVELARIQAKTITQTVNKVSEEKNVPSDAGINEFRY